MDRKEQLGCEKSLMSRSHFKSLQRTGATSLVVLEVDGWTEINYDLYVHHNNPPVPRSNRRQVESLVKGDRAAVTTRRLAEASDENTRTTSAVLLTTLPNYSLMQQVSVNLAERSYTIHIGTETLDQMASTLSEHIPKWSHSVVVADENVAGTIAQRVITSLNSVGKRAKLLVVPSGEQSKSIDRLSVLWGEMISDKTDRKSVVVAVGGGVVGDLAGFAAASFTRGLRLVQVPTTLLAMVDSSVGGKTGINLPQAKNMIGAFWQPHAVWIDTQTLASLPEREYLSGLAEVVKYGVILDEPFFAYLEEHCDAILKRDGEVVQHIVRRSCELKAQVVSQDERETTGIRAILNYGHTFGHAIEAKTAYGRFLHGEAISIGMTMAARLAARMGLWPEVCVERQSRLLQKIGLPTAFDSISGELLMEAMQLDKKTEHGKLNFILPTKIGYVRNVADCQREDILASIR